MSSPIPRNWNLGSHGHTTSSPSTPHRLRCRSSWKLSGASQLRRKERPWKKVNVLNNVIMIMRLENYKWLITMVEARTVWWKCCHDFDVQHHCSTSFALDYGLAQLRLSCNRRILVISCRVVNSCSCCSADVSEKLCLTDLSYFWRHGWTTTPLTSECRKNPNNR